MDIHVNNLISLFPCFFFYVFQVDVGHGRFLHIRLFQGISEEDDWELDDYQVNKTKNDELTYF
jgi:cystatin-A/B